MALNTNKSGHTLDMDARLARLGEKSVAPVTEKVKPDRMNLRFDGTNGEYVRSMAADRKTWPGGATQYINWLIEQDRAKNENT